LVDEEKNTYSAAEDTYNYMTKTPGHFKNGKWIEDVEEIQKSIPKKEEQQEKIEERIKTARESVFRALQDVLNVGRDIVSTKEGHKHVEETCEKAGNHIEKALNDIITYTEKTIRKKK